VVGARTYQLWQAGPWDLPVAGKPKALPRSDAADQEPPEFQMASTRTIIEKNLFDPERGAVKKSDAVAKADDQSLQRIKSMVLLGTAILGSSRYAIVQEPGATAAGARSPVPAKAPPPAGSQPPSGQKRLKLGDTVEGFRLAEIRERSIVFTKGPNRVEVSIDFFRPGEEPPPARGATPTAPVPQRPGLAPRVRVPQPGEQAQAPGGPQGNESAVERARRALRDRQLQAPQQPGGRPPERENAPAQNPQ